MRYSLESEDYDKIIQQHLRAHRPIPEHIANQPELDFGLDLYWIAFGNLTTCRYSAGGPIPYDSIDNYCVRIGIHDEDREIFITMIRAMDSEVLRFSAEQSEKK